MLRRTRRVARRALVLVAVYVAVSAAIARSTPLTLNTTLDQQLQGLSVAEAGVGLESLGSGTQTISISISGPVQKALLYWAGRNLSDCPEEPCFEPPPPFGDQQLIFDGNSITGSITGQELDNIGYKADVTNIVAAEGTGLVSFTIQDANTSNNLDRLDGAGLIVLFNDPSSSDFFRVIIFEGLDFAFGVDIGLPSPDNLTTAPVTFDYSADGAPRTGELVIFAGDGTPDRPDRIDVTDNASLFNQLDGSDGAQWDTDRFNITIPAGATSTTVQLFSEPADQRPSPDSLLWVLGALRIPIASPSQGCTPGYWKNHLGAWGPTGFSPNATLESVFDVPDSFGLDSATLKQALGFPSGSGTLGGARILIRAGVASLLNSSHPDVNFTLTESQVITQVNAALASGTRNAMISLASQLDTDNNLGCPLG